MLFSAVPMVGWSLAVLNPKAETGPDWLPCPNTRTGRLTEHTVALYLYNILVGVLIYPNIPLMPLYGWPFVPEWFGDAPCGMFGVPGFHPG